jgi:hypothetical protein
VTVELPSDALRVLRESDQNSERPAEDRTTMPTEAAAKN